MLQADPRKVSSRAKKRGLPQLGTLGAGNHYAEIQVRLKGRAARRELLAVLDAVRRFLRTVLGVWAAWGDAVLFHFVNTVSDTAPVSGAWLTRGGGPV